MTGAWFHHSGEDGLRSSLGAIGFASECQRLANAWKGRRFRELVEPHWRIIYLIEDRRVRVIAVVDSRRDLDGWLGDQAA